MALTSTEQLFVERPLYRCFLRNNLLPYIYPKQKQSPWGVLKNFAKFTRKHQCQSLFLIISFKFLRTSFLTEHLRWLLLSKMWLTLQFSIFHVSSFAEYFLLISFQEKNEIKKGKYPDRVQIFTFFLEYRFVWRYRFRKKFDRWYFDRKRILKWVWCRSFHG